MYETKTKPAELCMYEKNISSVQFIFAIETH